jgi:hypothetical protein
MRKILTVLLWLTPLYIGAQNLQLHYDLGKDRKYYTATLEMFRPDSLGSTYWFIDLDFNFPGAPRSMSATYWEISREFYIPWLKKNPSLKNLAFHLEYNDGFTAFKDSGEMMGAASYNSVFLTGFSYPVRMGNVRISTQGLVRIPRGMDGWPDFQITLVWFQPVFRKKVLITGFIDFWTQDRRAGPGKKEVVIQTEPQFWFMVRPKLAVGSEIEISHNFPSGPKSWQVNPTVAFRWEF